MRRPLVAGNWKLNGSFARIEALLEGMQHGLGGMAHAEVVVCPPFVYLEFTRTRRPETIALGAQDVCEEDAGAYTGEVSAPMLKEFDCRYVIVGHSERRALYGEDDARVARKFAAAQRGGIIPILCVGERLEEREAGVTEQVVARQLDAVIELQGVAAFSHAVIAYEPVWAIGTGKTATPEQAQAVHAFIRQRIASQDRSVAEGLRILYGGSVNGANAADLLAQPDINGGLIGGASLKADEFLTICKAAR